VSLARSSWSPRKAPNSDKLVAEVLEVQGMRTSREGNSWYDVQVRCPHCGGKHGHGAEIGGTQYQPRLSPCRFGGHEYLVQPMSDVSQELIPR